MGGRADSLLAQPRRRIRATRACRTLCLELHGYQNVYSVATLKRLRDAVGDTVGANLDPSHLMWMGADPLAAAACARRRRSITSTPKTRASSPSIAGVNGVIDTTPGSAYESRAWNYITLGRGHDESWWRGFVATLADVGYDGVLSIEHEDPAMSAVEGVEKSVALLRRVIVNRPPRAHAAAVTPRRRAAQRRRVRSRRRAAAWDPRHLYRKLFAGDDAAMEAFPRQRLHRGMERAAGRRPHVRRRARRASSRACRQGASDPGVRSRASTR